MSLTIFNKTAQFVKNNERILLSALILIVTGLLLSIASAIFIYRTPLKVLNLMVVPAMMVFTCLVSAFAIYSSLWLNEIYLSAKLVLRASIYSSTVFILEYLTEILWLLSTKAKLEPYYFKNFVSLSVYQAYHPADLLSFLVYPLQTLNLWEVLYVISMVFFLNNFTQKKFPGLGLTVSLGYAFSIIAWIVFVTFLNILNQK